MHAIVQAKIKVKVMQKPDRNRLQIRKKTITDGIFAKYILKTVFKSLFAITGWTAGPAPRQTAVVIGAPHTSNWDFIYGIGSAIILDVKAYFSIKESWCRIPLIGNMIMYLGAIPIDRSTPGKGQVEQISEFVREMKDQRVYFGFTPEGTRGKVSKWKTGFYHVALDCDLPIHLVQLDYLNKTLGVFHTFTVTGDKEHDVTVLQESYKLIRGRKIEKQFPDYSGPVPRVSESQARVMKALYQIGAPVSAVDIASRMDVAEIQVQDIEALVDKAILQKIEADNDTSYILSDSGKGCLLHLFPVLE